jgi:hypothetical protein
MDVEMEYGIITVFNIRVLDLLKDLGPYSSVTFLIFFNAIWLQVQPLADAARSLV